MIGKIPAFKANLTEQQRKIADTIDNTYLSIKNPKTDAEGVDRVCAEAKKYDFPAVCVRPEWISRANKNLEGTDVKVATVIGFPKVKMPKAQALKELGNAPLEQKLQEVEQSLRVGVDELDVVVNIPMIVEKDAEGLYNEASAIFDSINKKGADVPVKFIMETAILNDKQKEFVTDTIAEAKADAEILGKCNTDVMYKTSTGFVYEDDNPDKGFGATEHDVKFLLERGKLYGIGTKASGGVKTPEDAQKMVDLGVDRIGTSSGKALIG